MITLEKQNTRIHYLDSWRGIAALFVVLFHLIGPLQQAFLFSEPKAALARVLFDGTDWVSFFFVLSGFALSYGYIVSDKKLRISDFYIKRLLRIYPLYLFALLLCFLVRDHSHAYSGMSLLQEGLLFPRCTYILIPGWSLSVELCCSLLMPMVITLAFTNKYHFGLVAVAMLFVYNVREGQYGFTGYLFHFFLGTGISLLLKEYNGNIQNSRWGNISFPKTTLMLIIGYLFFSMRWYISFLERPAHFIRLFTDSINMFYHQLFHFISAIVSFMVIMLTIANTSIQRILSWRPFLFLGKISFSIYLLHYPIIKFVFPRLLSFLTTQGFVNHYALSFIIALVIIIIAVLSSFIGYITIEKPFINIAHNLVKAPGYIRLRENIKSTWFV